MFQTFLGLSLLLKSLYVWGYFLTVIFSEKLLETTKNFVMYKSSRALVLYRNFVLEILQKTVENFHAGVFFNRYRHRCCPDGSSHKRCSARKRVLRILAKFTRKHLCQSLIFNKKETLAQVFYCQFCEISNNTFFIEHLWVTASVLWNLRNVSEQLLPENFRRSYYIDQIFREVIPERRSFYR